MSLTQYYATGRRKTSVARVFLRPGNGTITVNQRGFDVYFERESSKLVIRQPLDLTGTNGTFDIMVNVDGGGKAGQAGAIRLGISRALCDVNPGYRGVLKQNGLLTRDSRSVERKKYGQPGARKRFQFSKR
jgi:small subunit ribosomal protein S9